MTRLEIDLRQTEIMFDEVYGLGGNKVVGMRAIVVVNGETVEVTGPRVRTRKDLLALLELAADVIMAAE